ncbi:uncharacterized protein LOC113343103 [Papaver somniferum]|uniref:uncharacterized protein LOC113343103 n=1 Tax=Papaver somniferum TaxID=3469 RepID=UPI000E6FDFB9|nr:uncharacterized protein LOC113343103 [Papaver somniferum]
MGTPSSGDCYPFQRPRVSVTALQPRTDPVVLDRYPAPKAKTPEELETSFVQLFKYYNEAAARNKEEDCVPEFAECEQKLIKVIRQFRNVKTVYHKFFPQLVNLKEVFPLMIELLKDDKCGKRLASCTLSTFEELTHEDYAVPGQREPVALLVKSLVHMGALEVFVSTLGKFSERDDLRAVQNVAQLLFQSAAAVATIAGGNHRFQLGQMGTVPVVVNALSSLTSSDEEKTEEEEDLPWTLFGCLFFLLEHLENKVHFVNAGGVKVMIKLIQDEVLDDYFCGSAIAALDVTKDCPGAASDKFVNDALELDIAIFPPSIDTIHGSTMHFKAEIEECLISLIESLTGGIAEMKKDIFVKKFEENDGERITWLMEHFIRYSKKVDAVANHLKNKQLDLSELYKEKLRCGFSTLQSIAVILGYLWSSEINAKIESELSRHQIEKKDVQDSLSEYRDNIGSTGRSVESTKTVIEDYIASLEVICFDSLNYSSLNASMALY